LDASASKLIQVFNKFRQRDVDAILNPDYEYCICNDTVYVGRLYPCSIDHDASVSETSRHLKLAVGTPGRPSTLHWTRQSGALALKSNEVRIEIISVGLNFRVSCSHHSRLGKSLADQLCRTSCLLQVQSKSMIQVLVLSAQALYVKLAQVLPALASVIEWPLLDSTCLQRRSALLTGAASGSQIGWSLMRQRRCFFLI
jgi:hypothetical protein